MSKIKNWKEHEQPPHVPNLASLNKWPNWNENYIQDLLNIFISSIHFSLLKNDRIHVQEQTRLYRPWMASLVQAKIEK